MLLWMDGFDDYPDADVLTSAGYIDGGGYLSMSVDTPHGLGQALRIGTNTAGGNGSWNRAIGNHQHVIVGAHYKCGEYTNNLIFELQVGDGKGNINTVLTLFGNEKRGVSVLSGGNVLIETPPNVLFPNVWYFVEWEVDFLTGKIVVRINDSEIINQVSGFLSGTTQLCNIVAGGSRSWTSQFDRQLWDNLYILDPSTGAAPFDTFLGEIIVFTGRPGADIGPNEWNTEGLALAGHFDAVNDLVYDDTDYLHIINPDLEEWFSVTNLPIDTLEVLAVGIAPRVSKDGGGGVGRYKALASVNTDIVELPTRSASTNPFTKLEIMETTPSGAAWSIADANNLNVGIRSVS